MADRIRSIYDEIEEERLRQDAQWGGAEHDDSHERHEWESWIEKQNHRGYRAAIAGDVEEFESRMIKVAALAVAAIESSRRQRQ